MSPSLLDFLRHILHECEFILRTIQGKSEDDVIEDELLNKAIVRSLEIIGEASKRIPDDFRMAYPQISWKDMAAMRDVLIHNYFGVDYEVVWNTITNDIPDLYDELVKIIAGHSPRSTEH